jgi:hypothetical protein
MAVVSCTLMREVSGDAQADEMNRGRYQLRYQIVTNSLMGPNAVANAALLAAPHPLPSLWSTYSYQGSTDSLSYARSYDVKHDPKSNSLWYITVQYEPPEPGEWPISGGAPIKSEPVPWNRDPVLWWDREVYTSIENHDKDDKAIVNKCSVFYEDIIELDKPRGVLVIEFNVQTLAEVIAYTREFDQAVNSVTWTAMGTPPRMALCREVASGPPQAEHGYSFFHLAFRIVFSDDGATWDYRMPEMGEFHWKKNTVGEYILDEGNRQRFRPAGGGLVALAADGTRLDDGQDIIFTEWRIRREVDFNQLPV